MSPGMLYRCVALFELCDRLDAPARWRDLGASHLRAVLGLPAVLQEHMLSLANSNRWTVEVLDSEVRKHSSARTGHGGRRAQPVLVTGMTKVRQSIDKCRSNLDCLGDCEPQHLRTSARAIAEAQESLDSLAELVSKRIQESIPPAPIDESDFRLPPAPRTVSKP
jgi:hypothetical protein